MTMNELICMIESAPDGEFVARALGIAISTGADTIAERHGKVRDAVRCHFKERQSLKIVRLHPVREEIIAG